LTRPCADTARVAPSLLRHLDCDWQHDRVDGRRHGSVLSSACRLAFVGASAFGMAVALPPALVAPFRATGTCGGRARWEPPNIQRQPFLAGILQWHRTAIGRERIRGCARKGRSGFGLARLVPPAGRQRRASCSRAAAATRTTYAPSALTPGRLRRRRADERGPAKPSTEASGMPASTRIKSAQDAAIGSG